MRSITSHAINPCNEAIAVAAIDGPGPGGARHQYTLTCGNPAFVTFLQFQNGPVKENGEGVNGITNEALLAIVIDRLEGFQTGPFPSQRNLEALGHLRRGLAMMHSRTRERMARGVEGTNQA